MFRTVARVKRLCLDTGQDQTACTTGTLRGADVMFKRACNRQTHM